MTVRWGILGVAKINDRWIPGFRMAQGATLQAIASRDLAKARAAAHAADIPVAHGSYEALLDDPTVDAIYIPLPNHLHAEWTKKAADCGKHVLCEKPLTPTAAEARDLIAYCKSKNVRLLDGFMWPHHPRTAQIRSFLDSGGIGDVRHVTGAFTFPLEMDPENIRLNPATAGGSLLDVGCYPVYGIRWALGAEPVQVFATATLKNDVDLSMSGVLSFAQGQTATFDCGFTAPFRGWLEIVGTAGVIRIPEMWLPSARAQYEVERDGRVETRYVDGANQIACMVENFSRAVESKVDASPAIGEAEKTLRVLDALATSARSGQVALVRG